MSKIKQSLAWWCFGRFMEAEDLIGSAKAIGYAGVEMAPENLWPQIVDGGLKIITMGGHQSLGDGSTLLLTILVEHNVVEVKAKVVYELAKGDHAFEVGVEFLEVAPTDKAILETLFPAPVAEE